MLFDSSDEDGNSAGAIDKLLNLTGDTGKMSPTRSNGVTNTTPYLTGSTELSSLIGSNQERSRLRSQQDV